MLLRVSSQLAVNFLDLRRQRFAYSGWLEAVVGLRFVKTLAGFVGLAR